MKNINVVKDTIPFGYAKSYIYKQALNRLSPYFVHYQHERAAYSDLMSNIIYLPFIEPLDFGDLKVLLEHEEGHFKITKEDAKVPVSLDITKARKVLNILEDMLVNESIPRNRLERVFKKLGGESLQITLWSQYSKDEKERVVNRLKGKLFKDLDTKEIIKTIETTIKDRKSFDGVNRYVNTHFEKFKKFYNIFKSDLPRDIPGNGPAEYNSGYYLPDVGLTNKFRKIFQNLKVDVEYIGNKEQFYGKRINRKYLESLVCLKPFLQRVSSHIFSRPKVLLLLDCSGSMIGQPEIKAKSFIAACLDTLDATLIGHNQYYHVVTKNKTEASKLPMTGDECFDKLKPEDYSSDVFVVISDLDISRGEARGLLRFGKHVKAKYKYLLVCSTDYYSAYPSLNEVYKRHFVGDPKQYIEFAKKLTNNLV